MSDLSLHGPTSTPPRDRPGPADAEAPAPAFAWPMPPLASYPLPAVQHSPEPCEVDGRNGQRLAGMLLALDAVQGIAQVHVPPETVPLPLRLDQMRCLTLTRPLTPLSAVMPHGLTGTPTGAPTGTPPGTLSRHPRQPYTVHAVGGPALSGETIGHVDHALGLFLFPPAGGAGDGAVLRRFYPRAAFERFDIGLPIGGVLVAQAGVSSADVDDAVQAQKKLRGRKLGELLVARRIVTMTQLFAALDQQARMPMVRLGDALVALGYVTPDELAEALLQQQRDRTLPLGALLTQRQLVSAEQLRLALAYKLGYPWVDLDCCLPSDEALARLPAPLARRLTAVPLHLHGGRLVVALPDPTLRSAIETLERSIGVPVAPVLANEDALVGAIARCYPAEAGLPAGPAHQATQALDRAHGHAGVDGDAEARADAAAATPPPIPQAQDGPVQAALALLVTQALHCGATDIHLEAQPGADAPLHVRLRRDGRLAPATELPSAWRHAMAACIKTLAALDVAQTRRPQRGCLPLALLSPALQAQLPPAQAATELQVTTLPTHQGLEDVVLRLPVVLRPRGLAQLGLESWDLARLTPLLAKPAGLLLVAGPARSGRTTTLHALMASLDLAQRTCYGVEERLDIRQPGMRQIEVAGPGSGGDRPSAADALRALQAIDADVLMVGELRDAETARLALDAAASGRLVLAGVAGRCAAEAVSRLIDLRLDAHQLADALLGVHAQRLLRRLCSHCRMSRPARDAEIDDWLAAYLEQGHGADLAADRDALRSDWLARRGRDGVLKRYHGAGCPQCEGTGHRGLRAVHELLLVSREMRRLIRASAPAWHLHRQAQRDGLRTLRQDGIEKVLAGYVAPGELRALADLSP